MSGKHLLQAAGEDAVAFLKPLLKERIYNCKPSGSEPSPQLRQSLLPPTYRHYHYTTTDKWVGFHSGDTPQCARLQKRASTFASRIHGGYPVRRFASFSESVWYLQIILTAMTNHRIKKCHRRSWMILAYTKVAFGTPRLRRSHLSAALVNPT